MNPTKYNDFCAKVETGRRLLGENPKTAYTEGYPVILGWFSAQREWTADTALIGSLMVYGWMPTMLKPEKTDFNSLAKILNCGVEDETVKSWVHASWVGTSKFLHFWKPEQWAIWDSRVCKVLGWGASPNSRDKFLEYQEFCRQFACDNPHLFVCEGQERALRKIEQWLYLQYDSNEHHGKT